MESSPTYSRKHRMFQGKGWDGLQVERETPTSLLFLEFVQEIEKLNTKEYTMKEYIKEFYNLSIRFGKAINTRVNQS